MRFHGLNTGWLLVPILLWNLAFTKRLPQEIFRSDAPQAVLILEHLLRAALLVLPFLFPLEWRGKIGRAGLALYAAGMLAYFASWLPLMYRPDSLWSLSRVGLLAPAFSPALWLLGIALLGRSWWYGLLSLAFVGVHVYHNIILIMIRK